MRPMKVYIAGPYSTEDPIKNTARAIRAGNELLNRGYCPFIPHLSHFWHLQHPQEWATWIEYDIQWLDSCDVLLRLVGSSRGADLEVKHAYRNRIPVVIEGPGDLEALALLREELGARGIL